MTTNQPFSDSHSSAHNHINNVSHSCNPDADPGLHDDVKTRSSNRFNSAPSIQHPDTRTAGKRLRRPSVRMLEWKAMKSKTASQASQRHQHQRSASSKQRNGQNDATFVFISTDGMKKKRGRKSARVTELEEEHEGLLKKRKIMVDTTLELESLKHVQMTVSEKLALCEDAAVLNIAQVEGLVDLLARRLSRPELLSEANIDLNIVTIDNALLREIQFFIRSPVTMTTKEELRTVEEKIKEIEKQLVVMRYESFEKSK